MKLATKGTETENLFETLAQKSAVGLYIVQDGKFCYTNPAFQSITGYTEDELLSRYSLELVVPEDREMVRENAAKMLKGKLTLPYQFRVICKDDSIVWVMETIRSVQYHGKRSTLADFINITEYKQAEEALRQSEEKHRALFDSSVIGMFVMNAETMKVVMANQAAAKMLGFSSTEQAIGVNPLDFVHPEYKDKALEITMKEMFEQDLRSTHDYRVVNKDGREGWASVTCTRIIHEGRLAGLVSIIDITERKQAVEALRQSEERYRTILEETEDAYFEVDFGGHLTFVNKSMCRDVGYSMEELMGMNYKGFTAEDDIESVFRVFNEVYQTGVPNKGFLWKTTRKDGSHGFVETAVSPLRNNKGEIIGFRGVGRDFTRRKETEEKLRQSEENYRAMFDSSVTGAFVIDAETMNVVIANQAALKTFGFSSLEEAIGVDLLDFVPPDDEENVLKLITREIFEKDSRRTFDVRAITRDGKEIWISATGARITHGGRLAGLISFMDITERKQVEEALRQSEKHYRALLDSAVIGTIVVDAETVKIIIANQVAAKMFGFISVDEMIGTNPLDVVPPQAKRRVLEIARKELVGQDLRQTHEFRAITKDGREIWTSITGARILHKGRLAALISFTDITERKRAEESLRQSEENYRTLFDNSVISTVVLDAETMKIVIVNQAALKIFGFSSVEEAFEAEPFEFILPQDREKYLEIAKKALFEQNSHESYEIRAMTKDGREKWINTTATKITHKGKLAALISFVDITEQKKQTERLMMTDRLASIGELAAGAAHEINNPLTSVIGFSQLLMGKEIPDDIREHLKLINNEAQRAAIVTRNLLAFAQKHAPVKRLHQINNIIEDVLELRAHEHKVDNIDVERHLAPDLPEIMVDYFQMQQVFMNIIINAEYFMTEAHNRGTLTITTQKQTNTVMISFADDGPGILPENLNRIFDPFFTTKEAGKGTGLGLSICHGIVTEHRGQIYARSQLGKGATIFVELPIKSRGHIRSML